MWIQKHVLLHSNKSKLHLNTLIDLCKAFYFIMVIVNTSLQPDFVVWCSLLNFLEYYNIVWDKI